MERRKFTMIKKEFKLLLLLYFVCATLLSPCLYAATGQGDEQGLKVVAATSKVVMADQQVKTVPANTHPAFWGLGIALIGFVALSRRRGI